MSKHLRAIIKQQRAENRQLREQNQTLLDSLLESDKKLETSLAIYDKLEILGLQGLTEFLDDVSDLREEDLSIQYTAASFAKEYAIPSHLVKSLGRELSVFLRVSKQEHLEEKDRTYPKALRFVVESFKRVRGI